jgi:hypothetical protein
MLYSYQLNVTFCLGIPFNFIDTHDTDWKQADNQRQILKGADAMLPQTQFILVVILLIVALLVLTYEMRYSPRPQSELPEELSQNSTQVTDQKETSI